MASQTTSSTLPPVIVVFPFNGVISRGTAYPDATDAVLDALELQRPGQAWLQQNYGVLDANNTAEPWYGYIVKLAMESLKIDFNERLQAAGGDMRKMVAQQFPEMEHFAPAIRRWHKDKEATGELAPEKYVGNSGIAIDDYIVGPSQVEGQLVPATFNAQKFGSASAAFVRALEFVYQTNYTLFASQDNDGRSGIETRSVFAEAMRGVAKQTDRRARPTYQVLTSDDPNRTKEFLEQEGLDERIDGIVGGKFSKLESMRALGRQARDAGGVVIAVVHQVNGAADAIAAAIDDDGSPLPIYTVAVGDGFHSANTFREWADRLGGSDKFLIVESTRNISQAVGQVLDSTLGIGPVTPAIQQ